MKKILLNIFNIINEDLLRIIFLISVLLRTIPTFDLIIGPLTKVLLLWGIILFVKDIFIEKMYVKNKFKLLIFMFLIAYGVSILVNYKDNFINNISSYLYMFIKCFVLYSYDTDKSKNKVEGHIKTFNNVLIIISFIGAILSIMLVICNVSNEIVINSNRYLLGVFSGRLYGLFGNPNTCGIISTISILFSIIHIYIFKNKIKYRYFLYFNILVQLSVLGLTGSRGAILSLFVGIILLATTLIFTNIKLKPIKCKYVSKVFLSSLVIILGIILIFKINSIVLSKVTIKVDVGNIIGTQVNQDITLERESFGESGGGRIRLWKSGFEVIKAKPILGVTSNNIPQSIMTYSDNYPNIDSVETSMHNEIIQVFVCSGIIGGIIFIYIILLFIKNIYKDLKNQFVLNKYKYNQLFCLVILGTLFFNNMLESGIVYGVLHTSVIFWSYLSYCMYFTEKNVVS